MNKTLLVFLAVAFAASSGLAQPQRVIRVKPGFATIIQCPTDPELVTLGNPDQFSVQTTGNYVLVKPLVTQGTTNMFIKAGIDTYNLLLQVAGTPDLEVTLVSQAPPASSEPASHPNGVTAKSDGEVANTSATSPSSREIVGLSPKAKNILSSYLKTSRPYTYSVVNSKVTFAVDHLTMIDERLYVICTLQNNSSIPYDIGYVRFRLMEYASSYLFFKKKIKEEEFEPIQEKFATRVKPNDSTRMLFVFEKHGFTDNSELEIKCNEENGRRDLLLRLPGKFVE